MKEAKFREPCGKALGATVFDSMCKLTHLSSELKQLHIHVEKGSRSQEYCCILDSNIIVRPIWRRARGAVPGSVELCSGMHARGGCLLSLHGCREAQLMIEKLSMLPYTSNDTRQEPKVQYSL